ncbi:phospholipase D-like domain-containing protein [Infirmifilum uzonense]|uniref:phospholipase D-like domain-containing protein n=1 Tax=Infirmifilum uzonense TaxID=1550241 RepID=UPI000699BB63|nr:phospholipase D-like domain-containing protein [Infirmifilum uzonense]
MRRGSIGSILLLVVLLVGISFLGGYYLGSRGRTITIEQPPATAPSGIKVEIINDRDYYPKLLSLLSSANRSIYVAMFEFKSDTDEISRIVEILIGKSKKGVDVKVVLENTIDDNELTYRRLLANGVPVRFDTRAKTTHAKLIIVDGRFVIVGSHNWSYMAMMRNHEASVLIDSPEIANAETEYFMQIWGGN